jgi:hypothetical protein
MGKNLRAIMQRATQMILDPFGPVWNRKEPTASGLALRKLGFKRGRPVLAYARRGIALNEPIG